METEYLISTALGFMIVKANSATEALVTYAATDTKLGDMCLNREDLLRRGYTKIRPTVHDNVFELTKQLKTYENHTGRSTE